MFGIIPVDKNRSENQVTENVTGIALEAAHDVGTAMHFFISWQNGQKVLLIHVYQELPGGSGSRLRIEAQQTLVELRVLRFRQMQDCLKEVRVAVVDCCAIGIIKVQHSFHLGQAIHFAPASAWHHWYCFEMLAD